MKKYMLLFLCLFFGNIGVPASLATHKVEQLVLKVKVIGVKDGDTIEVLYYQLPLVVRLEHIDAPEKKQSFGNVAKQKLSSLVFGKTVTIVSKGKKGNYDGRGRIIAEIYTPDKVCANREMLKAGLVWHYKQYSKNEEYAKLELLARKNRVGLWKDKNPIAPWNFRK